MIWFINIIINKILKIKKKNIGNFWTKKGIFLNFHFKKFYLPTQHTHKNSASEIR
jgi:hypothetical protein